MLQSAIFFKAVSVNVNLFVAILFRYRVWPQHLASFIPCASISCFSLQNNLSEIQRTHPVMLRTLICLGSCLALQFKWEESQTIFEQVLSHYEAQKGKNSVDSLSVLMQISELLYR